MGCGVWNQQIKEIERALGTMRKYGIGDLFPAYRQLEGLRSKLLGSVGFKFPNAITLLASLAGFSPGTIKLWHNAESGWMSEFRPRPGAPPVYKAASDEVAMAIMKREITDELEERLAAPDQGIDN